MGVGEWPDLSDFRQDRFARLHKHHHGNEGLSTLSSDHALSELASMHETVAQERARQRPFEAEEQNPAPGPTERNARWHRFVQARIAGRPKPPSFQELAEE